MAGSRVDGDLTVTGNIVCAENAMTVQTRASILRQEQLVRFPLALSDMRVWDAPGQPLPTAAANDDLAVTAGTWGTHPITLNAGDCKAATSVTRRATFEAIVPECYDAAETLQIAITGGMKTTISDGATTVDLEVYLVDRLDVTSVGSDLCQTAATSINSTTLAEKAFDIDESGLAPGDRLLCRLTIACADAATATAVDPVITAVDLLCDIKG